MTSCPLCSAKYEADPRVHLRVCPELHDSIRQLLGAPDPAIWVTRDELRRVVIEAFEPRSICDHWNDPKPCVMECGFGHLQGCEAVKEYLHDQLLYLDEFLESMK